MKITNDNNELRVDGLLMYQIPDHPDYYARVDGTLWSTKGKGLKQLKMGLNPNTGYNIIKLDNKSYNAHAIFCRAFHGEKPHKDWEVAHWNSVKTDQSALNLRWTSKGRKSDLPSSEGFFHLSNAIDDIFSYQELHGNLKGRLKGFINKYSNGYDHE